MPRPIKCRKIYFKPDVVYFKPAGIPGKELEEIILTLDEVEAVRLTDFEGLYQEEAALQMGISRQTLGNIIVSAHKKIADCILNGKILKIKGGKIKIMNERKFICKDCNNEWAVPFGIQRPDCCPACKSLNIHRVASNKETQGKGCCCNRRQGQSKSGNQKRRGQSKSGNKFNMEE